MEKKKEAKIKEYPNNDKLTLLESVFSKIVALGSVHTTGMESISHDSYANSLPGPIPMSVIDFNGIREGSGIIILFFTSKILL